MTRLKTAMAALFSIGLTCTAHAKQFYIADGDVAALKAAINTANTNNSPDTIHLALLGMYDFTSVDNSFVDGDNALPVIIQDGSTTNYLTILGNGATLKRDASISNLRLLYLLECKVVIYNVNLIGGQAKYYDNSGGAILINGSDLSLYNSLLKDNSAKEGGAVWMGIHGNFNAKNCTFTNNTADFGSGSAITTYGGQTVLQNCVVVNNVCLNTNAPAAIFNYTPLQSNTSTDNTYLKNTIVAKNIYSNSTSPDDGKEFDLFGATYTQGGNFIGSYPVVNTGFYPVFTQGLPSGSNDYVGTDSNPIDPKLGPLDKNGLFTHSYSLQSGSLALLNNAGISSSVKVPTIASVGIDPPSGYAGDIITLRGVNLSTITKNQFTGSTTFNIISSSDTTIHVTVPANAQTGSILLQNSIAPYFIFTPQNFIVKVITTPAAPVNLTGTALSTSSIWVTWQDDPDEDNYQIEYKMSTDNSYTVLGTTAQNITSYTAQNLLCNKTYNIRVMALGRGTQSGYSNIATVTLSSLATPTLASPAVTSGCTGNSIAVTAPSGFAGYTWSNGETTQAIAAKVSGDYSVQVKDNGGCVSNFSTAVTLTFYTYPDTAVSLSGNTLTALATADSYQWYSNNDPITGSTQKSLTLTKPGVYKVDITKHGCTATSRNIQFTSLSTVTGLEEPDHSGIAVYPVPASRTLTLDFNGDLYNAKGAIQLQDLEGKILCSINKPNYSKTLSIDTNAIESGIYILRVNLEKYTEYRKVVIHH